MQFLRSRASKKTGRSTTLTIDQVLEIKSLYIYRLAEAKSLPTRPDSTGIRAQGSKTKLQRGPGSRSFCVVPRATCGARGASEPSQDIPSARHPRSGPAPRRGASESRARRGTPAPGTSPTSPLLRRRHGPPRRRPAQSPLGRSSHAAAIARLSRTPSSPTRRQWPTTTSGIPAGRVQL